MELETLEEFTGSNDHAQIVRGKRSKRPRTSSPFGVAVTSSSSSGGGGGGGSDGGGVYFSVPSPTTSADVSEEEEDMANCLIMLAQSGCPRQEIKTAVSVAATTAGFYVYECKTCNRTFPSFQALGGHRASHKRPKAMMLEKKGPLDETGNEEKEEGQFRKNNIIPLDLSLHTDNKAKVHECSICGAEFASGQALGGHMRRHRNPTTPRIGTSADSSTIEESHQGEKPRRKILSLDLNLPAPEDDHSKIQQHLVFSSPSLVDCHY